VVECTGFENRPARKGSGSSNLPLSASFNPPAVTSAGGVINPTTHFASHTNRPRNDPDDLSSGCRRVNLFSYVERDESALLLEYVSKTWKSQCH
jgi:hypothetical protein